MGKLTDIPIRNWIKAGERFEERGDDDGLFLSYRENFAKPIPSGASASAIASRASPAL